MGARQQQWMPFWPPLPLAGGGCRKKIEVDRKILITTLI
jgi:hypothetical protein